MRSFEGEHADTPGRKYAYDFDYRMHAYMLRAFEPLPAGSALELGCHHGEFTKRLLDRFDSVTVVEGASDSIQIARDATQDRARFVHAAFEDFRPETRYDAIFLIHTLEHLDDPQQILGAVSSWLSDEGKLYVAVPNVGAASRRIAVAMGLIESPTAVTPEEYAHGHRRTYDLTALQAEVQRANLSLVGSGGILFKPFANFQWDALISSGMISEEYLEGCYRLGLSYPELCASVYAICARTR